MVSPTFCIEFRIMKNKDLQKIFYFYFGGLTFSSPYFKKVCETNKISSYCEIPKYRFHRQWFQQILQLWHFHLDLSCFFSKSYLLHVIMPQRKIHISIRQVCSIWMNWPNIAENQRLVAITV